MEWTEELIGRLRTLWDQGLPTAEIGRQLSISKNAVVGKAHRLKLPPRPSPIKNRKASEGRKPTTPRKKTSSVKKINNELPLEMEKGSKKAASMPLGGKSVAEKQAESLSLKEASAAKEEKKPTIKTASSSSSIEKKEVAPQIAVMPRAYMGGATLSRKVAPVKRERDSLEKTFRQGLTCQWPHGNPGEPDFHFCGDVPLAGKPYCATHAAIAYVKIRDRRE